MEAHITDVVVSTAGHDKGGLFLVLEAGGRLLLADGKNRKLGKPKRKNPAHVRYFAPSGLSPAELGGLTDKKLRKLLATLGAGAEE